MSEGVASLGLAKSAEAASVCACFNLRKASRIVTQMYNSVLRPSGLQATQLNLLVAVALAGPITVSDLAHALVMDRTTLTRNLKPLQAKRLIQVVSGEDRRRHVVTLTERGRRRVAKALLLWEEAQAQLIQELGHKRWRALLADLRAIASLRKTVRVWGGLDSQFSSRRVDR